MQTETKKLKNNYGLARNTSARNISPKTESKQFYTTVSGSEGPMAQTAFEKHLHAKLGYEWKNIYRQLVQIDQEDTGLVDITDFDDTCLKFRVSFSRDELGKIKKYFGEEEIDQ